jgi:hypothetical protein
LAQEKNQKKYGCKLFDAGKYELNKDRYERREFLDFILMKCGLSLGMRI